MSEPLSVSRTPVTGCTLAPGTPLPTHSCSSTCPLRVELNQYSNVVVPSYYTVQVLASSPKYHGLSRGSPSHSCTNWLVYTGGLPVSVLRAACIASAVNTYILSHIAWLIYTGALPVPIDNVYCSCADPPWELPLYILPGVRPWAQVH